MWNPFAGHAHGAASPGLRSFTVTPNDNADLPMAARSLGVYVPGLTSGQVAFVSIDGTADTWANLPAASWTYIPVGVARVKATGTTAGLVIKAIV
ncbi:MAG: hypothetical protein NW216_07520 [Hyphomicrobium sp.]|nr:hypothetical protein [Hyphomicrobium sp.]